MKKYLLLIFFCGVALVNFFACKSNPTNSAQSAASATDSIAILLHTVDGGQHWTELSISGIGTINDVIRKPNGSLVISGSKGGGGAVTGVVMQSTDNGATWNTVFTTNGGALQRMHIASNKLYIAGNEWLNAYNLTTLTWTPYFCLASPIRNFAFDSVSSNYGYLIADSAIMSTNNFGVSWSALTTFGGNDLAMYSEHEVICATPAGLQRSTDFGSTWTTVSAMNATSVRYRNASASTGIAVGADGSIARSTSPAVWTAVASPAAETLLRVTAVDATTWRAIGARSVYASSDDGLTWQREQNFSNAAYNFHGIYFEDGMNGWISGD